jgi:DNA-binding phage protein
MSVDTLENGTELERVLQRAIARAVDLGENLPALAARAGVTAAQLYRFTRHERTINLKTAGRIAAALGLTLTGEKVDHSA